MLKNIRFLPAVEMTNMSITTFYEIINFHYLCTFLKKSGFINSEKYPLSPHFIPGIEDASLANQTFNEYISLNVKANKAPK